MNIQKSIAVMLCFCSLSAAAQEAWDIDRCMAYAVEHNRTVKQRKLEADNYRLNESHRAIPARSERKCECTI